MKAVYLKDLTWPQAKACAEAGAWVLFPVGSTEAHGPHLPLFTDTILSDEVTARAGAVLAEEHGIPVVIAPTMPFGVTDFAAPFAGTISLRESTLTAVLDDTLKSLQDHGFSRICLINNHLEPGQLKVLSEVASRWNAREDMTAIFANNCSKRWARTLTDEFKSGACHAGQYETSLVLVAREELVRQEIAAELEPNPASLSWAIREGATNFVEAGGPDAYFGYPADASVNEGEETYGLLTQMVVTEILEATAGEGLEANDG